MSNFMKGTAHCSCYLCTSDNKLTSKVPVTQVRVELYDVRRTKFVEAHTTALACLALSLDGKLLATASERGTLVRVFSTTDGSKLQVPARQHTLSVLTPCMLSLGCV